MSKLEQELLFVYNAKSGFLNGLADLVHKGVSPQTYPCKLCQLTYRGASMDETWRAYIDELGTPATFLHKDEFAKAYPDSHFELPTILLRRGSNMTPLVTARDFDNISNLTELMAHLSEALDREAETKDAHQCPECGLHYTNKKTAEECAAWCARYNSCNLEITKYSIENRTD